MSARQQLITVFVLYSMFIIGCSDGSDGGNGNTSAPFQELFDQGIDRYIGVFTPMTSETVEGGAIRHSFGSGDGPLCFTGNEFFMSTRDGDSDRAAAPADRRTARLCLSDFRFSTLAFSRPETRPIPRQTLTWAMYPIVTARSSPATGTLTATATATTTGSFEASRIFRPRWTS